jgi:hypothetical protein
MSIKPFAAMARRQRAMVIAESQEGARIGLILSLKGDECQP